MKKLFIFIAAAMLFAGCDKGGINDAYYANWEGEYEMRTEIYSTNPEGEQVKAPRAIISPVLMFVENNHLYIRTNGFGMPNLGEYDEQEIEGTTDPPMETPTPAKIMNEGDTDEGGGIETIEANHKANIILRNGMVYVLKDNKYLKSLPIKALDVKEDRLFFKNSDTFDVLITNENGDILGNWRNHYEYGPAVLKDGTITWNVELYVDPGMNTSGPNYNYNIKYQNTLVRK